MTSFKVKAMEVHNFLSLVTAITFLPEVKAVKVLLIINELLLILLVFPGLISAAFHN